jgi:uncharacterized OB-fold protein
MSLFSPAPPGSPTTLTASRCPACLRVEFPAQAQCPACATACADLVLAGPATLGVCTSVAYPPPGALVAAPYRVGVARFDAGISVLGIVVHDAAPGDAVEPVVLSLEDGGTSFAFAPAP